MSGLVLATLLCACGSDPGYSSLPAGSSVLAFGDSVTYGTGAGAGQDYPTLLAQATGWNIVNAGIPGDTAREAKTRLPALLQQHRPALVIVELGGNDFLRKRPAAQVKADLHNIITQSQDSGAITAVIAVPRLSLLRAGIGALSDADIYAELATETGVLLLADSFSAVLSDEQLRADPVHPNARGYQVLSEGVLEGLREAGLL
ncbi:MAG: GDSL-type esterase/lipase family protein [Halieaceae bacterium]